MDSGRALLAAILQAPEDDLPRLIYADWLEEHGQADYAAFIRLQLQLANASADDPRRGQWERQQRELLQRGRDQWAAPLRAILELPAGVWGGWVFRRGLVEYFHLPAAVLLQHGQALAQATPLRAIYAHPCSAEQAVQLAAQRWFSGIVELYVPQTWLSLPAVIALVDGPQAQRLQRLVAAGVTAEVDDYWLHACQQRFGVALQRSAMALPPARPSHRRLH